MVQLLQTQRDIYARSVQEYSGKAMQADTLVEENKQLQNTIDSLRFVISFLGKDHLQSIANDNRWGETPPAELIAV